MSLVTMIQQSMICLSDVCQSRPLLKMKTAFLSAASCVFPVPLYAPSATITVRSSCLSICSRCSRINWLSLWLFCSYWYSKSCSYMKQSSQCAVSFLHEQCAGCPYQDQCKPKIFKKVAKIVTSKAAHERAKIQRNMDSKEFKNYARLRNGVIIKRFFGLKSVFVIGISSLSFCKYSLAHLKDSGAENLYGWQTACLYFCRTFDRILHWACHSFWCLKVNKNGDIGIWK